MPEGNQLWLAPYSGTATAVDPGENVYITGVGNNFTTMKLNSTGSKRHGPRHGLMGDCQNLSQAILVDSSTNIYVAGLETQSIPRTPYQNVGLLKYDANGKPTLGKRY